MRLDWRLEGRVLPDDVATTAYYVASEAVTNAVKHAKATNIGVVVGADDDGTLHVSVEDDGRGGADPAGDRGSRDSGTGSPPSVASCTSPAAPAKGRPSGRCCHAYRDR